MNIRAISAIVTFLVCICFSSAAIGEDWHAVSSPFCSQIKAKGAKVWGREFAVYEATKDDASCCTDLPLKLKGKTERFGYFEISGLSKGRYFLVFDLKTKQITVPISVDRQLGHKWCEPSSRINVDKVTGKLSWEEWVTVD